MTKKKTHKTFFITAKADILFECYAKSKKEAEEQFNSALDDIVMDGNIQIYDDIVRVETADQHLKRDCWP
jgi:hypothetical protein